MIVLVALSLVADAYALARPGHGPVAERLIQLVDLDGEANAPAFYSTCLLLGAAVLLALSTGLARVERSARVGSWLFLTVVFAGLAFDEAASLHETMIGPFRRLFDGNRFLYFGWVVPGAAFVLLAGVISLRLLRSLPPRTRNLFLLSGGIFVGGALGIELVEGFIASGSGEDNWPYVIALTVQETMEMAGAILFIYALLDHLEDRIAGLDIRWTAGGGRPHRSVTKLRR